jgi:type II secretory pathway component PulM
MATTLPPRRRDALPQWWQLRSAGERTFLAVVAALAALALLWLIAWQPLTRDVDRLERQLASERTMLADARRRADEIAGLARNPASVAPTDPRAALDAALARHGLKSAATTVERVDNERLRLTIDAIGFDQLTAFLDTAQREARLRAVEVVATARVEPGQVRADLTLAR